MTSTELTGMMEAGAAMLTRFESCSQQATQESDFDDPAFEKEAVRRQHFKNIAGSTWAPRVDDKFIKFRRDQSTNFHTSERSRSDFSLIVSQVRTCQIKYCQQATCNNSALE